MESELSELFESEERILGSISARLESLGTEGPFFPALQEEPQGDAASSGEDSPEEKPIKLAGSELEDSEGTEAEVEFELLGRLVRAFEEKRLFRRRATCPLCGSASKDGIRCARCLTPMDGKLLKKNVRLRKAYLPRVQRVSWGYFRIYDLFNAIGEEGFIKEEWQEGILVRNGATEYRVEWDKAWYILRRDGVKMLETEKKLDLIRGLWKLWEKGGADGGNNG